MRLEPLQ